MRNRKSIIISDVETTKYLSGGFKFLKLINCTRRVLIINAVVNVATHNDAATTKAYCKKDAGMFER